MTPKGQKYFTFFGIKSAQGQPTVYQQGAMVEESQLEVVELILP